MFVGKLLFDSHFVGRPGFWGFNPTVDGAPGQAYFETENALGNASQTPGGAWMGPAKLTVVSASGVVLSRIHMASAVWALDDSTEPDNPTKKRQIVDFFGQGTDLMAAGDWVVEMTQHDDTQATLSVRPAKSL